MRKGHRYMKKIIKQCQKYQGPIIASILVIVLVSESVFIFQLYNEKKAIIANEEQIMREINDTLDEKDNDKEQIGYKVGDVVIARQLTWEGASNYVGTIKKITREAKTVLTAIKRTVKQFSYTHVFDIDATSHNGYYDTFAPTTSILNKRIRAALTLDNDIIFLHYVPEEGSNHYYTLTDFIDRKGKESYYIESSTCPTLPRHIYKFLVEEGLKQQWCDRN